MIWTDSGRDFSRMICGNMRSLIHTCARKPLYSVLFVAIMKEVEDILIVS
ncbi:MAG: hypothetical protein Greene041679_619 [Parcubacteria group bacterium Greene0416_79]|nr:MAG: hypothetical protein Greene041679_619 [Parcubacteria group bacterium Greene0416_79]